MKTERSFVASNDEPSAPWCHCGERHGRLAEALACAKRVGLESVWSVELRGPIAVPRARVKVKKARRPARRRP